MVLASWEGLGVTGPTLLPVGVAGAVDVAVDADAGVDVVAAAGAAGAGAVAVAAVAVAVAVAAAAAAAGEWLHWVVGLAANPPALLAAPACPAYLDVMRIEALGRSHAIEEHHSLDRVVDLSIPSERVGGAAAVPRFAEDAEDAENVAQTADSGALYELVGN